MNSLLDFLQRHPYFSNLDERQLNEIARCFHVRRFARGGLILLEGDTCQGVYFVADGHVQVFRGSEDGRIQTLVILGPGHQFNEVPALDNGPNPASAEALTDTTLYVISRDDFRHIVERHPEIGKAMLEGFAARLRHLVELASDLTLRTVPQRLAKLLLEQAHMAGKLTQHEMAARLGTVREVVGRALRTLTEDGLIRIEGPRIIIVNREGLERKAGLRPS